MVFAFHSTYSNSQYKSGLDTTSSIPVEEMACRNSCLHTVHITPVGLHTIIENANCLVHNAHSGMPDCTEHTFLEIAHSGYLVQTMNCLIAH